MSCTRNLRVQAVEDSPRTADEGSASVDDGILVRGGQGDGLGTDVDRRHRDHPVLGLSQVDEVDVTSVQGRVSATNRQLTTSNVPRRVTGTVKCGALSERSTSDSRQNTPSEVETHHRLVPLAPALECLPPRRRA